MRGSDSSGDSQARIPMTMQVTSAAELAGQNSQKEFNDLRTQVRSSDR